MPDSIRQKLIFSDIVQQNLILPDYDKMPDSIRQKLILLDTVQQKLILPDYDKMPDSIRQKLILLDIVQQKLIILKCRIVSNFVGYYPTKVDFAGL